MNDKVSEPGFDILRFKSSSPLSSGQQEERKEHSSIFSEVLHHLLRDHSMNK